jgi:hypothetical protein
MERTASSGECRDLWSVTQPHSLVCPGFWRIQDIASVCTLHSPLLNNQPLSFALLICLRKTSQTRFLCPPKPGQQHTVPCLFTWPWSHPHPHYIHTSSRGTAGPGVDQLPKPNCLLPLTRSPIYSSPTKATSVFNFTGIDVVNLWRNGWDRHAQRCSFSMYYTLHSPPASPSEEGGSKSSSLWDRRKGHKHVSVFVWAWWWKIAVTLKAKSHMATCGGITAWVIGPLHLIRSPFHTPASDNVVYIVMALSCHFKGDLSNFSDSKKHFISQLYLSHFKQEIVFGRV